MRLQVFIGCLISLNYCFAQYSFSGYVNASESEQFIYLSIVEDYRKISGLHAEQIIAKTSANNDGFFEFKGNMLDAEHRIYRIHIDGCDTNQQNYNHFNGHCNNSEAIAFVAKNTDTIKLPFSFGKQIFCQIQSNNPKANAFIKVDALKDDMRFAYGEFRSEANRRLNNKKWFKTLQEFGKNLNEPLVELYIYDYLSDRGGELHSYYVEDLKTNPYYDNLKARLKTTYPNLNLTTQYVNELEADKYMLEASHKNTGFSFFGLLYVIASLSLLLNAFFMYRIWHKKRKSVKYLKAKLSKQEQVVLEHLLQNKSNKAIAETLFLSVSTIKTHIHNIYKKLNVESRAQIKSLFVK